jgi:hypothetical protein
VKCDEPQETIKERGGVMLLAGQLEKRVTPLEGLTITRRKKKGEEEKKSGVCSHCCCLYY